MDRGGALSGYRALDLTDEKGRLCPRLLADMGAEVVRIQKPGVVEDFSWENLGKLGITLDIEAPAGREVFRKLASTADILVESYPPGYLAGLGLDYPRLSAVNPRLIMASITSFGQGGPYRNYKATDLITSAMGSQMCVSGEPDRPPLKLAGNQTYYTACLFAAIGIMLALWDRHSTGRGQYIDISIQECAAATLDHVLVRYFYLKEVARRQGSLHWNGAFRIFPCRDGYILLSLFLNWETLIEWLDSEGMAADLTDKKWLDPEYQAQNIDHVVEVLEGWTRTHTVAELVETGQLMRFPWAEVNSVAGLVSSQHLRGREFFITAEQAGQEFKLPGPLARLGGSPWRVGERAPGRGQDNKEVFGRLGLTPEELKALARDGII